MSIRLRVILSYLLIIGVGFFYLVKRIVDLKEIKPRYMEAVEESLVDAAGLLASMAESDVRGGQIDVAHFEEAFRRMRSRSVSAQIFAKAKSTLDLAVYLTDERGTVIFDSDGGRAVGQDFSRWNDVYLTLHGRYGSRSTRADKADPLSSTLFVAAPIRDGERIAGVLTVSKPQRSLAPFMTEMRQRIILMGAFAAALVVIIGSLSSSWLTRPIQRLTRYAEAVRDGRRVALPPLGPTEIRTLGRTIEDMRDALEGRKYVENYVQVLTHEIKSPVSAIRGAAELLQESMPAAQRDRFLANIRTESARIQEIVERLLLLSSTEARKTLEEKEAIDMPALLREIAAGLEPALQARGVRLGLATVPAIVEGDRFLLEKAILNLLQNALAFAPDASEIEVALAPAGERWRLTVRDHGPGIPEYALPRVFERFFSLPRPGTGRKSSGLGLAFVQEVAALHRGTVTLANAEGGGAVAVLELPARL